MTQKAGPILILLVLLGMFGARWTVRARADTLLRGEAQARATVRVLADACLDSLAHGRPLPALRAPFPAGAGALVPLAGVGNADISYASDGTYFYGLASHPHRDPVTDAMLPGFVLRAWPAEFGATGDLEYVVGDDGKLWEGQNRSGRSGTRYGFPPPFPELAIGKQGMPWWPAPPAHK